MNLALYQEQLCWNIKKGWSLKSHSKLCKIWNLKTIKKIQFLLTLWLELCSKFSWFSHGRWRDVKLTVGWLDMQSTLWLIQPASLTDWLIDWLVEWLIDWLTGFIGPTDLLAEWLTAQLANDWLTSKEGNSFFDLYHGLTPLKRNTVWRLYKIHSLIVQEDLFFLLDDDQTLCYF